MNYIEIMEKERKELEERILKTKDFLIREISIPTETDEMERVLLGVYLSHMERHLDSLVEVLKLQYEKKTKK